MSAWLTAVQLAAGVNVVLLVGLSYVWIEGYRDHGASHTLGLLLFAVVLLAENVLWLVLYVAQDAFVGWFLGAGLTVKASIFGLCAIETVALVILARITWQ
jgi:hypothetical protein